MLSLAETPSGHSEVLLKGSKDVCRLLTSLQRFPVDKTPSTVRVSIEAIPDLSKASLSEGTHVHTFSVDKGPTGKL